MIQLVREFSLALKIRKTPSCRRGFLFYVAAGFQGDVDPLSGMILNLRDVDQILNKFKSEIESSELSTGEESLNNVFRDIHQRGASMITQELAQTAPSVSLASLRFREERGFGWQSNLLGSSGQHLDFFSAHYIELFPAQKSSSLLRITGFWRLPEQSSMDVPQESFKLLKPLMNQRAESLVEYLEQHKNFTCPGGEQLVGWEVLDLTQGIVLEI